MVRYLDSLFDIRCLVCSAKLDSKAAFSICSNCRDDLEEPGGDCCPLCASPSFSGNCPSCAGLETIYYDEFKALYYYNETGRKMIHRWKIGRQYRIGEFFSTLLEKKGLLEHHVPVTAVPATLLQKIIRGKTGLHYILKLLQRSGYFVLPGIYRRKLFTGQQKKMKREKRFSHIAHRFYLPDKYKKRFSGPVYLLDDIFTTGATINYGAKLLKEAGFTRVTAISLFRVLPQSVVKRF